MTDIPQTVLRARQMYVEGKPVRVIQAETGLSLAQLYHALDGLPQPDGSTLLPPIPRRRIIARKTSRAATRVALVARLMRAAELQLHGIEQQLETAGYVPGKAERRRVHRAAGAHAPRIERDRPACRGPQGAEQIRRIE